MNDELRKLLEHGDISKYDIKDMLKKGELSYETILNRIQGE